MKSQGTVFDEIWIKIQNILFNKLDLENAVSYLDQFRRLQWLNAGSHTLVYVQIFLIPNRSLDVSDFAVVSAISPGGRVHGNARIPFGVGRIRHQAVWDDQRKYSKWLQWWAWCVSNHQQIDWVFKSLLKQINKTPNSQLLILYESNPPVTVNSPHTGPVKPFPCCDFMIDYVARLLTGLWRKQLPGGPLRTLCHVWICRRAWNHRSQRGPREWRSYLWADRLRLRLGDTCGGR